MLATLSEREQAGHPAALRPRRRPAAHPRRGGPEFGLSRERIRQIEKVTLLKLREPDRVERLAAYASVAQAG